MVGLAVTEGPWQGQVGRTREWFEPHLERIYDSAQVRAGRSRSARAARAAVRHARSVSCGAGARSAGGRPATSRARPYLDEDYLVLSTVHSAKGQEWDAVYILNVADGNFPSEFSTGPVGSDRRGAPAAVRRDDAGEERPASDRAAQVLRHQSAEERRPPRLRRAQPVPDEGGHGQARRDHVARGRRLARGARVKHRPRQRRWESCATCGRDILITTSVNACAATASFCAEAQRCDALAVRRATRASKSPADPGFRPDRCTRRTASTGRNRSRRDTSSTNRADPASPANSR